MSVASEAATPIGPGRLILVVGPSGAGKDTLLAGAQAQCANDRAIVFARRVVTRSSSAAEDHDSIAPAAFDDAVAHGRFAFWWEAHGHKYGIPIEINNDIRAGRTVVCNGSRATVPALRTRYLSLVVVLITASAEILSRRLASRARKSDGELASRLARNDAFVSFKADTIIENTGTPEAGIARLMRVIAAPVD